MVTMTVSMLLFSGSFSNAANGGILRPNALKVNHYCARENPPGQTIELPLDGAAWERKLMELIANSKLEKTVVKTTADDFASSFRK